MSTKRPLMTAVFAIACCVAVSVRAQQVESREYELKAAYLFHFATLCTWPSGNDKVVIGVVGRRARYGRQLERIVAQGRGKIDVVDFNSYEGACDIVLVIGNGAQAAADIQTVLRQTANQAFVVAERPGVPGVGVTFSIENNRLRLHLNTSVTRRLNIKVPARLSGLPAVITHER